LSAEVESEPPASGRVAKISSARPARITDPDLPGTPAAGAAGVDLTAGDEEEALEAALAEERPGAFEGVALGNTTEAELHADFRQEDRSPSRIEDDPPVIDQGAARRDRRRIWTAGAAARKSQSPQSAAQEMSKAPSVSRPIPQRV